ncbi:MAG: hypothetical protein JW963_21320 [Anaerolineales bacterium]|nr:hypothetical protein [Anaerolineales bacterium]
MDDIARRRNLIDRLRESHAVALHNGEWLEQKGWHLLTYASSLTAVVGVLQIILVQATGVSRAFYGGLIVLLLLYLVLTASVSRVIWPGWYSYPIALPLSNSDRDLDDWEALYLQSDEVVYLTHFIGSLVGTGRETGVIQKANRINSQKARYLQIAAFTLGLIVVDLVAMAVIALLS